MPVTPISTQNPRVTLPAAPVQDLDESALAPRAAGTTGDEDVPAQVRRVYATPFGLTPLASAFRYIEPTWRNYIMYVDMEARTGNEDARRYLRVWQSLPPKERNAHVPEQLCDLATVASADLVSWVTRHVWSENQASTSMVLSFNRARVLERTAEFAMQSPDNGRHAELFMKAAALLPSGSGRGTSGAGPISIYNMPVSSSGSVALSGAKSESSPVSASGLQSMDEEIVDLARIMQTADGPVHARAEVPGDEDDDDDDNGDSDDDNDD